MKIVKIILTVIIAAAALVLLAAAFLPSAYRVTRSIEIMRPADEIFPMVADFSNWTRWSPWAGMDPDSVTTVKDSPKGKNTVMTWEGPKSGSGSLSVESMIHGRSLKAKLVFNAPFEMESADSWTFEAVKGGTKVTWTNEGALEYPAGRFLGLFLDGWIGPDHDKGLANLKKLVEKNRL
jgi:hypothetical protein